MNLVLIPHLPTLYGRRYNLAKALAAEGHSVHFITWDMPYPIKPSQILKHIFTSYKIDNYTLEKNITVHKVGRLPLFWPVVNGWLFKRQVRSIYKQTNADFILSQGFTNENEAPKGLPLVYDMNDDHMAFAKIYGSGAYKLAYKFLGVEKVVKRQATRAMLVTVVSDKLEELAKHYNQNVIKVPNGVEKSALSFKGTAPKKPNTASIVYVSTFGKWSRVTEVIALIDRLRIDIPNIHLDLVGEGTESDAARQLIADLGFTNSHLSFSRYLLSTDLTCPSPGT